MLVVDPELGSDTNVGLVRADDVGRLHAGQIVDVHECGHGSFSL
jgi:hypothetical protein